MLAYHYSTDCPLTARTNKLNILVIPTVFRLHWRRFGEWFPFFLNFHIRFVFETSLFYLVLFCQSMKFYSDWIAFFVSGCWRFLSLWFFAPPLQFCISPLLAATAYPVLVSAADEMAAPLTISYVFMLLVMLGLASSYMVQHTQNGCHSSEQEMICDKCVQITGTDIGWVVKFYQCVY